MLEPALRSQGLSWRSKGMSLATLDHAQWFHRDVNVGDWLLLVQDSPSSTGGRAMARAEVFDTSGHYSFFCIVFFAGFYVMFFITTQIGRASCRERV